MTTYHTPVLLHECIEGLNIKPDGVYVDVTYGGGGHSGEIVKKLTSGKLVAFDQDFDASCNKLDDPRLIFCRGNFRFLKNFLRYNGISKIDGLLADLGVSSHHFDETSRGFTFQGNAPLDMRMNQNSDFTAAQVLNTYNAQQLSLIFRNYGEVENTPRLVKEIIKFRESSAFQSSNDFINAIKLCIPKGGENKYLAKVYQALRIEVNHELEALQKMLLQCLEVLKPNGRLVVITYHSLEDRIVKNFIKSGNFEGKIEKDFYGNPIVPLKATSNKIIIPSPEEIERNSRARSAKLRIAELIENDIKK